jgi:hypothetical protein
LGRLLTGWQSAVTHRTNVARTARQLAEILRGIAAILPEMQKASR